MFKRFVGLCLLVVAVLFVVSGCNSAIRPNGPGTNYTADWSTVQLPQGTFVTTAASQTMSESDYKAHCRNVNYKDFQNDVNAHKGEDVHYTGILIGRSPVNPGDLPSLSGVTPGLLGWLSLDIGVVGNDRTGQIEFIWPEPVPDFQITQTVIEVWGECQGADNGGTPGESAPPNWPIVRGRYMTVYQPPSGTDSQ